MGVNVNNVTDVYVLLSFSFILFIWIWTKSRKSNKEAKTGSTIGFSGFLDIIYTLFFKTPVITKAGQIISSYEIVYKKYFSSRAGNSKRTFAFQIFGTPMFVATDYDSIHQVNQSEACRGRGQKFLLEFYSQGKPKGILMNNDNDGAILKTFVKRKFAELGLKSRGLAPMLADQLSELLDHIELSKERTNNKIQVVGLFSTPVINVVATSLFGRKFFIDDPDFIFLEEVIREFADLSFLRLGIVQLFSKVWGVTNLCGLNKMAEMRNRSHKIIEGYVNESISLGLCKHEPESFIDFFLQEIEEQKDNNELNSAFCKEQLIRTVFDLFAAAMDTTSKSLESFLMFMCLYPEVQEKVQKEIESVLGTSAMPNYYECKSRMNYTMAAFWEGQRCSHQGATIPRITLDDVEIAGHHLKKGTVIANIYFPIRLDDTYWKDPYNFNPDNFLDSNGILIQAKVNRMLIFANGSRACPGNHIAEAVSFTFGVGILQRYTVKRADISEIIGCINKPSPVNGPKPFHVNLLDR